mmetsp:Transcript_3927/g.5099  ORF Transcript_3927/g.5099 Transcript_3927/m.5099 type:complete len:130 (+) Transcript_3927:72-461(+)
MEMVMYFSWSTKTTVLFNWWETNTTTEYIFTLLAWFVLGVLLEFFGYLLRDPLKRNLTSNPLLSRFYFTTIYFAKVTLAFAIMLALMSYNVGLFLVIIFGIATGHTLFDLLLPSRRKGTYEALPSDHSL